MRKMSAQENSDRLNRRMCSIEKEIKALSRSISNISNRTDSLVFDLADSRKRDTISCDLIAIMERQLDLLYPEKVERRGKHGRNRKNK